MSTLLFAKIADKGFSSLPDEEKRNLINQVLMPWQVTGFWSQMGIITKYGIGWHTSRGGAGKTMMVSLMARYTGKNLLIFCNQGSFESWDRDAPRVGVKINSIMTYQKLRGTSKCDNVFVKRLKDGSYQVKEAFSNSLHEDTIVVYDEIHYSRNQTTFTNSALTAVSKVVKQKGCSLIGISATPSYIVDDAISFIRLFALVGEGELIGYDCASGCYVPLAIEPYLNLCKEMNPDRTATISSRPLNPITLKQMVFDLFTTVTIPSICIKVEPEGLPQINRQVVFYELPEEVHAIILDAEKTRNRKTAIGCARRDAGKGRETAIYSADNEYDQITEMTIVEHCMVKDAINVLENDANGKLLFFVNFRNSMERLYALLNERYPGQVYLMHGDTNIAARKSIAKAYRDDSDDCKILITSKDVGGTSYSLDDTTGNRKRYVFKRSGRSADKNAQLDWRTSRATSKSETDIRDYYIKNIRLEVDRHAINEQKSKNVTKYQGRVS